MSDVYSIEKRGRVTVMSCPKCANSLHEVEHRGRLYLLCRQGHRYSFDEMCPALEVTLRKCMDDALAVLVPTRSRKHS
jgi:hypothetical protein